MRRLSITGIFLLGSIVLNGQWSSATKEELVTAMKAAGDLYRAKPDMRLDYQILQFTGGSTTKPDQHTRAHIIRKGDQQRSEQLGVTTVQNEKMRIVVDTASRTMLIGPPIPEPTPVAAALDGALINSARSVGKQVSDTGTRYRVMLSTGTSYEAIETSFDKNGWLREITLHFHSHIGAQAGSPLVQPRMTLLFEPARTWSGDKAPSEFDIGRYLRFQEGVPVTQPLWAGYQIIDTRLP